MSDPLSVAGTAVGITSLGIQVCQGLIKYLRAVRGRKEEIAESVREVDRVVSLLSSVNRLVPRVGSANETAQLRDCLKNCHTELKNIETLLTELKDAQQSNKAMQRAANAMRSITYPFQQAKLTALRQSLRSVLHDLTLIISIVSLASKSTIQDTINTMSQDLKTHTSANASGISDFQCQVHCHSVQLRSLQSTISGTLDDITEQLHRTELSIQDFDQRVDGRLTIIESGTQSIEASSQVTVAKLEEIAKALASQSRLMENMCVQITGIQSRPNTDFATAEQNMGLQEDLGKALYKQSTNTRLWQSCHCASRIPKSKTLFSFWNLRFELEQQEHHLPSCKLWGTKKGMKRTAKATFPLKLAWLSARTTLACFQYATGTSQPSLSIRFTNIVPQSNSPVLDLYNKFWLDMYNVYNADQLVPEINLLEREILTLYTCGRASPGDVDEDGYTHAEVKFREAENMHITNCF
ncbi:unnamed protein product [Fusarium equiseti]|uniref:Fungal N-terminal domain-containing protein n=1 Tax=Fusarium equiseti TaxID=61235 RepID=A0A8J2IXI8_FUSEQ|nr:unnamed protein product [Fusarium equiseti]